MALRRGAAVTYLYSDHLGSTSLTRDPNGALARQWYYPYGGVRQRDGTLPTDYTFTGQRVDSNGLHYYQARYYDSSIGRFVQPDNIIPDEFRPQALNRYSYVYNNPTKYTDPSGHCALVEEDGLCTRFDSDETIVIVQGGKTFANPVEVALANAFLSGDTRYLNSLPDNVSPLAMLGSVRHVALALGYRSSDPVEADASNYVELALGLGMALNKATQNKDVLPVGSAAASKPINSSYAGKVYHPKGELLQRKYPEGVKFNEEGYPDFSPYAQKTVEIEYTGSRAKDFAAANKAAGIAAAPEGWTWHRVEDAKTMQLVPSDLHGAVSHTGGFSIWDSLFGR